MGVDDFFFFHSHSHVSCLFQLLFSYMLHVPEHVHHFHRFFPNESFPGAALLPTGTERNGHNVVLVVVVVVPVAVVAAVVV
jgi:hypothetical protein